MGRRERRESQRLWKGRTKRKSELKIKKKIIFKEQLLIMTRTRRVTVLHYFATVQGNTFKHRYIKVMQL